MTAAPSGRAFRVLFLGSTMAGHGTRFLNLTASARRDPRIRPTYRQQRGWREDGVIERLPLITGSAKGRLRTVAECAPFGTLPRPDVIWTSAGLALTPYLWSQLGPLHRPVIRDLDWTLEQQEELAPIYYRRPPRHGLALALARLADRLVCRAVTVFTPWSNWAAASLCRKGIPAERIRVIPPGVDLEQWRPRPQLRGDATGPLRLLFVGGDAERKGGLLLLDVFRERFAGRCEVDMVTRSAIAPQPGVRLHRAEPNTPALRELYARADLFVLPTKAECFGIAAVEALASGLPVIMGDVGGARDIVDDQENGWLIDPSPRALALAIEAALAARARLPDVGRRARQKAERAFNGARNDAFLLDLLVEVARDAGAAGRRAWPV